MIIRQIAKFFLRSARGQGLISKIMDPIKDVLEGTVYLFALKGLFGVTISFPILVGIVVFKKIIEVGLGWIDEKVGFWKAENYYSALELNPFNQELMERVRHIEMKVMEK